MPEIESFTPNDPHQGAWLVYINGLEIPCPNVAVTYGVGSIPEATLSFPPHRLLQRLGAEDRVEVVIFYLDTLADPENPEFKLQFEGEIIGCGYTNSPFGRQMTYNAIADISIWSQLYFFFMNTVDAVLGAAVTPGHDAATMSQAGVFYPFSLFKKGLYSVGTSKPPADIERPFDLLYNCVRGMIPGPDSRPDQVSIPAVNFFSRWARKRNFPNRFAALPLFEDGTDKNSGVFPIFKAVQSQFALETMQQQLSTTIGDAGSILQTVQKLLGVVYCEIAMLPTAPCYRVSLETGAIIGPADTAVSSPQNARKEPLRLMNYFVKPQMMFGIAPTCNLILPSMSPSYSYQENYLQQPTRMYVNEQLITNMLPQNTITSATMTFAFPEEVNAVLKARSGDFADPKASKRQIVANGKNVLVFPEEFYKGPVVSRQSVPPWFTLLKNAAPKPDSSSETNEDHHKKLGALYSLYAQYEYYRARYEKRGGNVQMAFNPYVVPGFPCYVFDERHNAFDTVGYAMSVTQTFSSQKGSGSMRTTLSYGFGRTIQEMLELLQKDMAKLGVVAGSAPAEPVDQVRAITQDFGQAEEFYTALFFGRRPQAKKASIDFRELVGYAQPDPEAEPETIYINGSGKPGDVHYVPATGVDGTTEAVVSQAPSHNVTGDRELQPLKKARDIFNSYDAAMEYVSRPICTLSEYIRFIHNDASLAGLLASGQVYGEEDHFTGNSKSARFYTRIRKLRQGPGVTPDAAVTGAEVSTPPAGGTVKRAVAYTQALKGLLAGSPQTRQDWDARLEEYREEILAEAPQR